MPKTHRWRELARLAHLRLSVMFTTRSVKVRIAQYALISAAIILLYASTAGMTLLLMSSLPRYIAVERCWIVVYYPLLCLVNNPNTHTITLWWFSLWGVDTQAYYLSLYVSGHYF